MTKSALNILWIEDRAATYAVPLDRLDKFDSAFFKITVLSDLTTMASFATSKGNRIPDFDAAICDFNLVPPSTPEAAISDDAHEAGLTAQAAGFMLATLLALRVGGRPSAIIPYSGDTNQFGASWRLLRTFLPRNVAVSSEIDTSRQRFNKIQVFSLVASTLRSAIIRLVESGEAHFSRETIALLLELEASKSAKVTPDDTMEVVFTNGHRRLPIGGVFYDWLPEVRGVNTDSLTSAVREFASAVQLDDENTRRARILADLYWKRSCRSESLEIYSQRDVGSDADQTNHIWIKTEPNESRETLTFACLNLCLRAFVATASVTESLNLLWELEDDPASIPIADVAERVLEFLDQSPSSFFARCLADFIDALQKRLPANLEELIDAMTRPDESFSETWELRWIRALDPAPNASTVVLSMRRDLRIGQGLSHLFSTFSKKGQESIAKQILSGDAVLPPILFSAARRYAFELIPSKLKRPQFLNNQPVVGAT